MGFWKNSVKLKLFLGIAPAALVIVTLSLLLVYIFCLRRKSSRPEEDDFCDHVEKSKIGPGDDEQQTQKEDLVTFKGGEDLTIKDILEAPGEVIGKSNYGTVYKAALETSRSSVKLLRFLRPACVITKQEEVKVIVCLLGSIRHPNLVPLQGFYAGPRGEKLFVHPFYRFGNLSQFIADRNLESRKWPTIYTIALGVAKGLDHLHRGLHRPIIHGNLKSKNILLDRDFHPSISDFGIYSLLNQATGQQMLESLASQGYKATELIKMKDANQETDIYSLGVIFMEILTRKRPVNDNPSSPDEDYYLTDTMRNAVFDRRILDLFHPDILLSQRTDGSPVGEERILNFFQLALACCSPSPSLRPNASQVVRKLEEIGS